MRSASASCRSTAPGTSTRSSARDRKSTRLNSSHVRISYAVFCLKKKTSIMHPLVARLHQIAFIFPTIQAFNPFELAFHIVSIHEYKMNANHHYKMYLYNKQTKQS